MSASKLVCCRREHIIHQLAFDPAARATWPARTFCVAPAAFATRIRWPRAPLATHLTSATDGPTGRHKTRNTQAKRPPLVHKTNQKLNQLLAFACGRRAPKCAFCSPAAELTRTEIMISRAAGANGEQNLSPQIQQLTFKLELNAPVRAARSKAWRRRRIEESQAAGNNNNEPQQLNFFSNFCSLSSGLRLLSGQRAAVAPSRSESSGRVASWFVASVEFVVVRLA